MRKVQSQCSIWKPNEKSRVLALLTRQQLPLDASVFYAAAVSVALGATTPAHGSRGWEWPRQLMRCWLPVTSLMEMWTLQPGSYLAKLPFINFMKVHSPSFRNAPTNCILVSTTRNSVEWALWSLDPNSTTWTDVMEKQGCQTHTFGKLDYTPGHHSISDCVETWPRDVAVWFRPGGRPMINTLSNINRKEWWEVTGRILTKRSIG